MLRRAVLISFTLALGFVAACGHQVTPEPAFSNLSGDMVIRFRTKGPMDFNNFAYVIVLDTCGGGEPYPQAYATNSNNYSYAFAIGANFGGAAAFPYLFQYILNPGQTQLNAVQVPLGASTTQLVLNDNGMGTEFQLTFIRQQTSNPLQVSNPCPGVTGPTPGPSPTAGPTPSPGSTATPVPTATTLAQSVWRINFFTLDASRTVQDSLGIGGATDTTFDLPIDTTSTNQNPIFRASGATLPANTAAQIDGGEIDNFI